MSLVTLDNLKVFKDKLSLPILYAANTEVKDFISSDSIAITLSMVKTSISNYNNTYVICSGNIKTTIDGTVVSFTNKVLHLKYQGESNKKLIYSATFIGDDGGTYIITLGTVKCSTTGTLYLKRVS